MRVDERNDLPVALLVFPGRPGRLRESLLPRFGRTTVDEDEPRRRGERDDVPTPATDHLDVRRDVGNGQLRRRTRDGHRERRQRQRRRLARRQVLVPALAVDELRRERVRDKDVVPAQADPPEHARTRAVLSQVLSPTALKQVRDRFAAAANVLAQSPDLDAVLFSYAPTAASDSASVARAMIEAFKISHKPLFANWLGGRRMEEARHLFEGAHIPTFDTPERAGRFDVVYLFHRLADGARLRLHVRIADGRPLDTLLATWGLSLALQQAAGDKRINFDTTKFIYIGNPNVENNTTAVWRASGVTTIDDAKRREVAIGSTGINTSSQYAQALNVVAGTRFKIVLGYPDSGAVGIAMERGEIGGRGANAHQSYLFQNPDWLRDGKVRILLQASMSRQPTLPDIPSAMDLARTDRDDGRCVSFDQESSESCDDEQIVLVTQQLLGHWQLLR